MSAPEKLPAALTGDSGDSLETRVSNQPTGKPHPAQLGDFELLRPLGSGGMGLVYLARRRDSNTLAAVKVLRETFDRDRSHQERFRREAQAIGSLNHPHLVPLISSGIENNTAYLAMRVVDGVPLHEVIASQSLSLLSDDLSIATSTAVTPLTAVPASECFGVRVGEPGYYLAVVELIASLAEALHSAHRCGIIHRDVKPSNILVDTRGKAWLTDFGLAACGPNCRDCNGEFIAGAPAIQRPLRPSYWESSPPQ